VSGSYLIVNAVFRRLMMHDRVILRYVRLKTQGATNERNFK